MPSVHITLNDMDWALVRQQKRILADLTSGNTMMDLAIEGVINLIETVQDMAAIQLGDEVVFPPVKELSPELQDVATPEEAADLLAYFSKENGI